ncbi:MAG: hypothetical protein LQ348_002747 [Seirophora lacunosa]|nr:MAG: hypothetical protein LQ344_005683 [Seirophora lacunosa]KAI4193953.1 MAG: hypothetical protein LQ348_002747 [Seirophora lacunosa]
MAAYNAEAPVIDTYQAVVSAFTDFLTVAIHTILYERDIYPRPSFLTARKFNCPVRQSRHPKVCKWIQDAVAAVEAEMLKCALAAVSLVIHAPPPSCTPLERYVFSTAAFPSVPSSELLTSFTDETPPATDLPEQFRATIATLSTLSSSLSPLPSECSFTLMTELRDDAGVLAPLGPNTPWIAAEPTLQKQRKNNADSSNETEVQGSSKMGRDLGGAKTTPVRNLESGAFALEMWIEEGRGKFDEQPG